MVKVGRLRVGALELTAPQTWHFYEFENLVMGRPDSGVGALQISTAFRHDLAPDASLAEAERLAREWLDGVVNAFETVLDESGAIGTATLGGAERIGCAWYLVRQGQLILGEYEAKADSGDRDRARIEWQEATSIVRSAQWRAA